MMLLLLLATALVYQDLRHHEFVNYDDDVYVVDNPHLRMGLSLEGLRWNATATWDANWIPVTGLTLLADYELYGLDATGFKATNLALHLLSIGILYAALRRMTLAFGASFFVAGVFALHPLHVESVAWVAERKDVLSGLFFMVTLWCYAGYASRPGVLRYLGVACSFALGLLAKPMLVTLPLVLLLLDFWPLSRLRDSRGGVQRAALGPLLLEKIPLLVMSAAASVITVLVQQASGAVGALETFSLSARISNALVAYLRYLGNSFWPLDLAVHYPHPGDGLPLWQPVAAALVLLGITVGVLLRARKSPWLPVGWLWFVGTLVPVIGLVQVGTQALADRYTYLPLVGLSLCVAQGVPELWPRHVRRKATLAILVGTVLVILGSLCALQVRHWTSSMTLFEHALQVTGPNPVAHLNLAAAYSVKKRFDEAEVHFEAAARLQPGMAKAQVGLGDVLAARGASDEAERAYQEAIRINPSLARAHAQLGNLYLDTGRLAEASTRYFDALRLHPDEAEIHANLGRVLAGLGRVDAALRHFRTAVAGKPDLAVAHGLLGVTLLELGTLREADTELLEALRLDPDLGSVRGALARLRMRQGRQEDALREVRAAIAAGPEDPDLRRIAGDLHLGAELPREAVVYYQEALKLNPDWPQLANNLAWLLATHPDPEIRDPDEAVRMARLAVEGSSDEQAGFLDTLAVAYAAQGRIDEALRIGERALTAARLGDPSALAQEIEPRLKSWRARATPPD